MSMTDQADLTRNQVPNAYSPLHGLTEAILLDWRDDGALLTLATRPHANQVWRIERELTLTWPEVTTKNVAAVERGEFIRRKLREQEIDAAHVIVAVPRRHAILKLIELESVSKESLTEAVLLQAEMRGQSTESFVIDYIPHFNSDADSTYALTAAYPRNYILEIQATIEKAGLKLGFIGIGELSLAGTDASQASSPFHLIIHAEGESYTFLFCLNHRPLSLLEVRRPSGDQSLDSFLKTTIGRILVSLPETLANRGIESVLVMGPDSKPVAEALEQLQCPSLQYIHPPKSISLRPWLIVNDKSPQTFRIDFSREKSRGDARVQLRQDRIKFATRLALVAVLMLLCFQFLLSRWDARIEQKTRELARLEKEAPQQTELIQTADQLASWETSQVDWSQEMSRFLGLLPGNSRIFIQRLRAEQPLDQPAEIRIEGVARSLDDAFSLKQRILAESPYYQMRPESIERDDRNPHYPIGIIVSASFNPSSESQDSNHQSIDENSDSPVAKRGEEGTP